MKKIFTILVIAFLIYSSIYAQWLQQPANILENNITINSPNAGDSLKVGTTKLIEWYTNYPNDINLFKLEYSTNNGSTWQIIDYTSEYENSFYWIVPNTPSNYCIIRITQDSIKGYSGVFSISGKLQWEEQNSSFTQQLNSVFFVNSSIGWIAGYDGLLKTTNKGESWYPQSVPSNSVLFDVFFIDVNIGWIVSDGLICKTTDGGENWYQQKSQYSDSSYHLFKVQFLDMQNGYILGQDVVLKTTNGGQSWSVPNQNPSNDHVLQTMFFINKDTGWIAGNEGVLLKTTDGGLNWIWQLTPGTSVSNFGSIYFLDKNTGWVSGSSYDFPGGVILKTTNGGDRWDLQLDSNNIYWSIYFNNYLEGWAVGENGKILSTHNGGTTWIEEGSGVRENLYSVYFLSLSEGWAVGTNGIILKYKLIDSNYVSVKSKLRVDFTPKEFKLYQNYPNPFNPSTTIKYALPFESSVDITIYNITGQRIEEFNEGIKEAGYHYITWRPEDLSSGVYFFSIVAKSTDGKNTFAKTIKMLLMK